MAEPIEMPFGGPIRTKPRNHVLDGVQIPPREGAILGLPGPLKSVENLRCTQQKASFSPQ